MSEREEHIQAFLSNAGWDGAVRAPLAGDASNRRYERLEKNGDRAVLMDAPPGPDGAPLDGALAYSQVAHIAEDCRPFAAIATYLRSLGLSAPEIYAADFELGFLLIEDLGNGLYGPLLDAGIDASMLYEAAVDALVVLHASAPPGHLALRGGGSYSVPPYDAAALQVEADLLVDWYVPARSGNEMSQAVRDDYRTVWGNLLPLVDKAPAVLILRDYHSPNLLWLENRTGVERVGIIDFQDGVMGSPAYDLMSLLQDARRDVSPALEQVMFDRYVAARQAENKRFEPESFSAAYATLGAQRSAKIIGIFTRLWKRDGKPHYLAHMPRVAGYLERNLAHPALKELKSWLDTQVPPAMRRASVRPGPNGLLQESSDA